MAAMAGGALRHAEPMRSLPGLAGALGRKRFFFEKKNQKTLI
jgi:hypothetical protein